MSVKSSVIKFDYLNFNSASKKENTSVCKSCNRLLTETAGKMPRPRRLGRYQLSKEVLYCLGLDYNAVLKCTV